MPTTMEPPRRSWTINRAYAEEAGAGTPACSIREIVGRATQAIRLSS